MVLHPHSFQPAFEAKDMLKPSCDKIRIPYFTVAEATIVDLTTFRRRDLQSIIVVKLPWG